MKSSLAASRPVYLKGQPDRARDRQQREHELARAYRDAKMIQSRPVMTAAYISDLRVARQDGRSIPSVRSCLASNTAARKSGMKTAASTAVRSSASHGCGTPAAPKAGPKTPPSRKNKKTTQPARRPRFCGMTSNRIRRPRLPLALVTVLACPYGHSHRVAVFRLLPSRRGQAVQAQDPQHG